MTRLTGSAKSTAVAAGDVERLRLDARRTAAPGREPLVVAVDEEEIRAGLDVELNAPAASVAVETPISPPSGNNWTHWFGIPGR